MDNRIFLCIDLKSFFASVECVERGLDAMTTNLVVADNSRTEKTICLAVSPSLKSFGIPGRPRLFEVVQKIKEVNRQRQYSIKQSLVGKSCDYNEIMTNPKVAVDYIVAEPRMSYYIDYSTKIYEIYLKYIAPEDIHVYSIDEVFMDITSYLKLNSKTPREFAMTIIRDVLSQTGITATAGIGTNMYLAKVGMDIVAKHTKADSDGVRIAELDERTYRKTLWTHTPLTDFWRIGRAIAKSLESAGLYTMGDIARLTLTEHGEDKLYKMFGVNAEFIWDHAWGYEPTVIEDIRSYKPESKSISSGQVLHCPYEFVKARLIVKEMAEVMSLDLVDKGFVTKKLVLTVGYDVDNLKNGANYKGEIVTDAYGRKIPKHAHGTINLDEHTSSSILITNAVVELFNRIVDKSLLVRRINISANDLVSEREIKDAVGYAQLDMFTDYVKKDKENKKERRLQEAILDIKKKYGKNSVVKGMNLEEGATSIDRNSQIGGHKA